MTTQPSSPLTMLLSRHTRRREFVTLLGGAVAWPLAARAQQAAKVPRIGFLHYGSPGNSSPEVAAFRQGLRDLGYIEGKNINIEYRFASGRVERLPELAAELVHLKPDVIVSPTTAASLAAKQATGTIPIVIAGVADAVGAGLVASIARPGRNVTGLASISARAGRAEAAGVAAASLFQEVQAHSRGPAHQPGPPIATC